MSYIEREKVLEIAKDEYYSDFHKSMADLTSLRELLEDAPTADVVEVVRCKDCLYATERYGHLDCIHGVCYRNNWNKPDDYCCHGVRKDGEE